MGNIKDAFDLAFREFVTAGVPGTGANEPDKSEIRAIGSVIEQFLIAAGITTIYETTAAGLASTPNGRLFLVKGTGNSFADLYKNNSGSAVYQGVSLPNTAYVDSFFARFTLPDGRFELTAMTLQRQVIKDLDGRAGGGPAVYFPIDTLAVVAPRLSVNQGFTPANTSSTEMPGYWKLALSSSASNVHTVAYFNAATSRYVSAVYTAIPSAPNGVIPIVSILGGTVTAYQGVNCISYDEWKLGTQAWEDIKASDRTIIRDRNNVYGTGAKWLVPLRFYNARGFVDADFAVNNAASTNLTGYCEIPISNPDDVHLLAFNTNTGLFINYAYAQLKTLFAQGGASIIAVAWAWRDQVFSEFPVRETIAPDAPISGARLFLVEGRPLPFYPQALYGDRQAVDQRVTTLTSTALNGSVSSVVAPALLSAEQFGATARIVSRTNSVDGPQKDRRYQIDLTVMKGPPSGSGSIIVHLNGDSLTANQRPDYTGAALVDIGYPSPTLIGTMNCDGAGVYKGEGRPGWQLADFTHENPRYPGITPGQEAAYLAMTEAQKREINPYIRPAQSGDDPDRMKNGWIFDYGNYLTKLGLPTPQHSLWNGGTNDVYQSGGAAAADQITRSYNNIFSSVRAAAPNCHIYAVVTAVARASDQDERWLGPVRTAQLRAIRDMVRYRRSSLGDTRVWFVPAYQHQNPDDNWPTYLISQDAQTQTQLRAFSDALHYGPEGRRQVAEAEAAAIHACHNLGYAGAKQTPLLGAQNAWTQFNRFNAGALVSNLNIGSELAISINSAPNPASSQHGTAINGITAAIGAWLNSATGPSYNAVKSRSATIGSYSAILSGDMLGAYRFGGDDGVGIRNGPFMSCVATENWSATARGSRIAFSGPPNGGTTAAELLGMQAGVGLSYGGAANLFLDNDRTFRTRAFPVATLPTVGTSDRLCSVSNALNPQWNQPLVGGGSVRCLAFDNGTAWTAH